MWLDLVGADDFAIFITANDNFPGHVSRDFGGRAFEYRLAIENRRVLFER